MRSRLATMALGSRSTVLCLTLALGLVAARDAGADVSGSGALTARSLLRVKGCGKQAGSFGLLAVVRSDGTWDAQDTQGVGYSGTHTPLGSSGRRVDVQFDASSMSTFVGNLVTDASQLCGTTVTVISTVRKTFSLRLNRRGTVAKLALVYLATGSAGGRQGSARFQLKAAGPWTPAP